jgi:hypothetical protein
MTEHNGKIAGNTIYKIITEGLIPRNEPCVYYVSTQNRISIDSVLYIGSSGQGNVFRPRVRIGSLIMSCLGFYQEENNKKHKGGEAVYKFCQEKKIKPHEIYIFWEHTENSLIREKSQIQYYKPIFNKSLK